MKQLIVLLASAMLALTTSAADKELRFFELRTYHAAPGKLEALETRFRTATMQIFENHGMVNIGYWTPVNNTNNLLIYILAYPDKKSRDESWAAFNDDPNWEVAKKESELNGPLVTKVDSVFMTAADFSPVITPSKGAKPGVFELRTYHAAPGKLDDLLARFRNHTVDLFNNHGLKQFGYWVPTEKKDGAGDTLIYILKHPSQDEAKANWKAFANDAEWTKAKKESEANGPLTTKIDSVYMMPTDFSPIN